MDFYSIAREIYPNLQIQTIREPMAKYPLFNQGDVVGNSVLGEANYIYQNSGWLLPKELIIIGEKGHNDDEILTANFLKVYKAKLKIFIDSLKDKYPAYDDQIIWQSIKGPTKEHINGTDHYVMVAHVSWIVGK